jgi:hypothetical protein
MWGCAAERIRMDGLFTRPGGGLQVIVWRSIPSGAESIYAQRTGGMPCASRFLRMEQCAKPALATIDPTLSYPNEGISTAAITTPSQSNSSSKPASLPNAGTSGCLPQTGVLVCTKT